MKATISILIEAFIGRMRAFEIFSKTTATALIHAESVMSIDRTEFAS